MADDLMEDLSRHRIPAILQSAEPRRATEQLRARLLRARRYILDDEVAAAASRLATRNPEILAQMLPGARPPHPTIWLEWNQNAQVDGTGFHSSDGDDPGIRIGAFVEQLPGKTTRFRVDLVVRDTLESGGQPQSIFVILPFAALHDTDQPLPPSAHADEEELAEGLSTTRPALATSLLGMAYFGSLMNMAPGDPEFYGLHPGIGGWREHRLSINRAGRLMLSEEAKRRLDISDEELDARQRVCERLLNYAALELTELGRPAWKAARRQFPRQQASLAAFHEILSMYPGFWGFVIATLEMMANPELVDSSDVRKAGDRRFVSGKNLRWRA